MPRTAAADKPRADTSAAAASVTDADRTLSLHAKLARIATLVGAISKRGTNDFHKYDYVKEEDLVAALRPLFDAFGIYLEQQIVGHQTQDSGDPSKHNLLTTLFIDYTWHDTLTGEQAGPLHWLGYGADNGDKGAYKAMTGCTKYFLMKQFLVATGDDPEKDAGLDRRNAAGEAEGSGRARIGASNQPSVGRGGRSGIATEAQRAAIGTAARQLGFKIPDLRAFIAMTLKVEPPEEPEKLRAFIEEMTSGQAGQMVAGLRDLQANREDQQAPAGDDPVADPVEAPPDDFDVV